MFCTMKESLITIANKSELKKNNYKNLTSDKI